MIDDFTVRQQCALFGRRAAELTEHILRVAGAPLWHFLAEIFEQEFAPSNTAPHRSARHRHADDPDRRLHHIDKCLVDLVGFWPPRQAKERCCSEIERQLFDRGIEFERGARPCRHPRRNPGVERVGV